MWAFNDDSRIVLMNNFEPDKAEQGRYLIAQIRRSGAKRSLFTRKLKENNVGTGKQQPSSRNGKFCCSDLLLETKRCKCSACRLTFSTMYQYSKKKKRGKMKRLGHAVRDTQARGEFQLQLYWCMECRIQCSDEEAYKAHEELHVPQYHCAPCGVSYFSRTALKSHELAHYTNR